MRAFYAWALDAETIAADPARKLPMPTVPPSRPRIRSIDDLRLALAAATQPVRIVLVLSAFTGLRCGEIARLQTRDLQLGDGQPAVVHVVGKGGRERIVPLLAPVVDELRSYGIARRGWRILSPCNRRPYSPDRLTQVISQHDHDLGIEATLHFGRHYFASGALAATRDPMLVRDLLGHASVKTTEVYLHPSLADAHARLEAFTSLANAALGRRHLTAVSST